MTWGTVRQFSEKYATPEPSVYGYIKRGIIPAKRIGGRWKLPMDKIDRDFNKDVRDANTKVW